MIWDRRMRNGNENEWWIKRCQIIRWYVIFLRFIFIADCASSCQIQLKTKRKKNKNNEIEWHKNGKRKITKGPEKKEFKTVSKENQFSLALSSLRAQFEWSEVREKERRWKNSTHMSTNHFFYLLNSSVQLSSVQFDSLSSFISILLKRTKNNSENKKKKNGYGYCKFS